MSWWWRTLILAGMLLVIGPATAGAQSLTLAVSYFDNNTGDTSLDAIEKGLADMMITDLSAAPDLTLVEREKLEAIVTELELSASGLVDLATAQQMGKLLSADLILTGSIQAVRPTLRLDARVYDVERGEIVATAKASGPVESFFDVETELVKELLADLGVVLSTVQRLKIQKPPTKSLEAFGAYSAALEAFDQGDADGAKAALRRALQADPVFERALKRLEDLEARVSAVERAGGIILVPETPADFWSNHLLQLERKETSAALTSLQELITRQPTSLDGLEQYAVHVMATAGKAPGATSVRRFAPEVDPLVADAVAAITAGWSGQADETTAALLDARSDLLARWLRVRALGPEVNPNPTAMEQQEELRTIHRILDPAARDAFMGMFTARASGDAAWVEVEARLAHYNAAVSPQWRIPRRQLVLPPVALTWKSSRTYHLRIAEPDAQAVALELADDVVVRPAFLPTPDARGHASVFEGTIQRGADVQSGPRPVTVRYTDRKGRKVETTFGAWVPPVGVWLSDNGWRNLSVAFDVPEGRSVQWLVDPVGRVWSAPEADRFHKFGEHPRWEGGPGLWGAPVWYRTNEVRQVGFSRPVALRFGKGTGLGRYAALGTFQFYWEWKAGERDPQARVPTETLAGEWGPTSRHLAPYPGSTVSALITAGEYQSAVDLALTLGTQDGSLGAASDWMTSPNQAYHLIYALAAARRVDHRYPELRTAFVSRPPHDPDFGWFDDMLAYLDGATAASDLLDAAQHNDAAYEGPDPVPRYAGEAATLIAVADPGWAGSPVAERIEAVAAVVPSVMVEWPLLTAVVREQHLAEASVVKVGTWWMDRWEVSVDDYLACVAGGECRRPSPATCLGTFPRATHCDAMEPNPYPINWLSQDHATAYCEWRGGRLPSADEWRAAAGGQVPIRQSSANLLDATACAVAAVQPAAECSGDAYDELVTVHRHDGWIGIAPRGAHPAGRTEHGVEQLVGNVREWLRGDQNEVAGCSYYDAPGAVTGTACVERVRVSSTVASGHIGFRCMYKRAPRRTPAQQGKRVRAPKARRGNPSIDWVQIPAGTLDRGKRAEPLVLDVGSPTPSVVKAVAAAVDGWDARSVESFLKRLRAVGITGELTDYHFTELAERSRGVRPLAQTLDLVLELLEPQGGEDAQDAAAKRAREELGASVYHSGAFSVYARKNELRPRDLTVAQRRQALFERMFWTSEHDYGMGDREMIVLERMNGLPSQWSDDRAPGCGEFPVGGCRDLTGIRGDTLGSGGYRRPEPVQIDPFDLMKTEVTQQMFQHVLGEDPSLEWCADCPVSQVTVAQAERFCKKIGGRLPSDDEWGFAARAGRPDRPPLAKTVGWSLVDGTDAPQPVGRKPADAYGLHDMLGNVWEYTADYVDGRDYKRAVRGGSWASDPRMLRPDRRVQVHATIQSDFIGFRCAR